MQEVGMQIIRIASLFQVFLLLSVSAVAQSGDWQAVRQLPQGTRLKIKLERGRTFGHCDFMGATDEMLRCEYPGPQYSSVQYRRGNIKAVYLVHNARAIGLGLGLVSGIAIGASTDHGPAATREGFAAIDAVILGGVGYFFGMVADPYLHGRAVYVNPIRSGKNNRAPANDRRFDDTLPGPGDCLRDGVTMRCVTQ
jgi:hypothetical protein